MSDTVEKILEHHGVKGMKWGVRRKAGRAADYVFGPSNKPLHRRDFSGLTGQGKVVALQVLAVSGAIAVAGITKK